MGCDGGTIPKRHELVKTAKRPPQKDKDMDRNARWCNCTITQEALTTPIMGCELGKLYSKESILEFLLDRSISENASHIRNLKDVKELKLTLNPGYKKPKSGLADRYFDTQASSYVCPVVGLEMNGKYKFCLLWTCGCVLSERAIKEVETDTCHQCGVKFQKDDIIILNPVDDDLDMMKANMNARREKMKALRKANKEKKIEKRKHTEVSDTATNGNFKEPVPLTNGKETVTKKSRKLETNGDSKAKDKGAAKKASETKNTNIMLDPTKSKVYKSLFTSSESSKGRGSDQKAHWVTYNPYHL